jgi:hypothetical protein
MIISRLYIHVLNLKYVFIDFSKQVFRTAVIGIFQFRFLAKPFRLQLELWMYRYKEIIVEFLYLRIWNGDARGFVLIPIISNEISVRSVSCYLMRRFPNYWRSYISEKELRLCRLSPNSSSLLSRNDSFFVQK